jgi:hypothetical protein
MFYVEWESGSVRRPSVETSRRTGDSGDSLAALEADCEDMSGALAHILGHSSMGSGASNIDGGIIALNWTTAAFVLNSGHEYLALHCLHRAKSTARVL